MFAYNNLVARFDSRQEWLLGFDLWVLEWCVIFLLGPIPERNRNVETLELAVGLYCWLLVNHRVWWLNWLNEWLNPNFSWFNLDFCWWNLHMPHRFWCLHQWNHRQKWQNPPSLCDWYGHSWGIQVRYIGIDTFHPTKQLKPYYKPLCLLFKKHRFDNDPPEKPLSQSPVNRGSCSPGGPSWRESLWLGCFHLMAMANPWENPWKTMGHPL